MSGQGIPVDRVVAVLVGLADGREQIGTGYLVARRLVLTAEHCTRDKKTGEPSQRLRVVRAGDALQTGARVVAASKLRDVAVLELDEAPWLAEVSALTFGRVDREHSGELRGCAAIGFPEWQVDPADSRQNTAQLSGTIRTADEVASGFLLLRDPLLETVTVTPQSADDPGPASTWGGLSGALVFYAGIALGVIVQHHPRQGAAAVRLVPFHRVASAPDEDTAAVAALLGLPSAGQLFLVAETGEAVPPLDELAKWLVHGDFPLVKDLDPYRLGATVSNYGNRDSYLKDDLYVPRHVDERLRDELQPGRLVLIVGPSKAGKTRTAWEALASVWPQAKLVIPEVKALPSLVDRLRGTTGPVAVWLDNIQDYLTGTDPLTPWLLARLTDRAGPTVILGTLRLEARDRLRDSEGELSPGISGLLDAADTIELASTVEDPAEQAAARAAYPREDLETVGLAERLAHAPVLLQAYHEVKAKDPLRYILVRVAIDWVRIGAPRPLLETDLLALAKEVLWQERPDLDLSDEQAMVALRWAREPLPGSGRVAVLSTSVGAGHVRGYWPFDYLVAADDGQARSARPIPEPFWQQALDRVTPDDAFGLGVTALLRKVWAAAISCNRKAAEGGIPGAMFFLGVLLKDQETPDLDGARHWWEQAARAGHTAAMTQLGLLLENHEPPDVAGARYWYQQAAEAGRTDAMTNLGLLMRRQDPPDLEGARRWWQQGADAGNPDAMFYLGGLLALVEPPDLAAARHWLQLAADAGRADAMTMLGMLLERQNPPDVEGARHWWQQAAEAGETLAMTSLGVLLASLPQPDYAGAHYWWQQAATLGDTSAMTNLGSLLVSQPVPDIDGALHWLRQAAAAGDPGAMTALGALLASLDPPDLDGARHWLRQAAETGDTRGMNALALLLVNQDPPDLEVARHWWQRAAEFGDTSAMKRVARRLAHQDPPDREGSRALWRLAADAGDVEAMVYAGMLLVRQDPADMDGATRWWRRAAEAGSGDAMTLLGSALTSQDPPDFDGARELFQQAAEAGSPEGMFALGVLLAQGNPPDLDPVRRWWQQAAHLGAAGAMTALAAMLAVEGDRENARALLSQAADAGDSLAQRFAAALDDDPAVRNAAAAELDNLAGNSEAQNFAGIAALRSGNLSLARDRWERSAEAGDNAAPILLFLCADA